MPRKRWSPKFSKRYAVSIRVSSTVLQRRLPTRSPHFESISILRSYRTLHAPRLGRSEGKHAIENTRGVTNGGNINFVERRHSIAGASALARVNSEVAAARPINCHARQLKLSPVTLLIVIYDNYCACHGQSQPKKKNPQIQRGRRLVPYNHLTNNCHCLPFNCHA